MAPGTVLVLDAHTTQALACARSLGRAGHAVYTVSRRRVSLAGWSKWSRGHYRLPDDSVTEYRALRQWARARGVGAVLPMTERACLLCNAERAAWEAAGIAVGCAPDDLLLQAFDKSSTIDLARRCGLQTPPTYHGTSDEGYRKAAAGLGFPCVVKARFSDAWVGGKFIRGGGATYVRSPAELIAAVHSHRQGPHWPILQRFVGGRGVGVSGVCDRGRIIGLFAHERLRDVRPTGSGSSLRRSIALEPRLRDPAERLLSELGWHGPVMVEFRDEGVGPPCLMEINGRFWGSVQLAVLSGLDLPAWWVATLWGEPIRPAAHYELGVTLRWLWGDAKRLLHVLGGPAAGYPGPYPSRLGGLREILGAQPANTRNEVWDKADPLPGAAEWVQGGAELLALGLEALRAMQPFAPNGSRFNQPETPAS